MLDFPHVDPKDAASFLYWAFAREGYWIEMGCIALIVYEYLLTVQTEHDVIWGRKLTVPTILFYLNRYTLLLFALAMSLWAFVHWESDASCIPPDVMQLVCCMIIQVCYTLFTALRIHAINHRIWAWTILIVCLGLVTVPQGIAGIIASAHLFAVPHPLSGCSISLYAYDSINADAWARVAIASEACMITMDVIAIGITWYRTAGIRMLAKDIRMNTSLASLMLRDGTVFFGLALGLHIIVIVVDETRHIPLVVVTCTFMSIIMTRFILNLRMLEWSDPESKFYSLHLVPSPSLHFASPILDNIGAPLDMDGANDGERRDEERNHPRADQELVALPQVEWSWWQRGICTGNCPDRV